MDEEKIILYSTHCGNCRTLERLLNDKKIKFNIIDDEPTVVGILTEKGLTTAPALQVGDKIYKFSEAVKWVRQYGNNA